MILITNTKLVGHIAMWLYRLAPKHQPRKVDVIMERVNSHIDSVFDTPIKRDPEFKTHEFENRDDLYQFIDELMKSIKEFRELNLTWQEYEAGIDVDSPDRENIIAFTSMYDTRSSEDWYTTDFIDLDAFIQDVVWTLLMEERAEMDDYVSKDTIEELKLAKQYLSELINIVDSFGLDKIYECGRVDYACKNCKYFSEHLNHNLCEDEEYFAWKHKQEAIDLINKGKSDYA